MAAKAMFPIFDITKLDQVPLYGASDRKRRKSDKAKKEQKRKYEEKSRKRSFHQKWLNKFAWLQYHKKNDLMIDAEKAYAEFCFHARAGMQTLIKNKFIMKLFSCIKFSIIFFCSELHVNNFVSTSEEISLALHKCLKEWL